MAKKAAKTKTTTAARKPVKAAPRGTKAKSAPARKSTVKAKPAAKRAAASAPNYGQTGAPWWKQFLATPH